MLKLTGPLCVCASRCEPFQTSPARLNEIGPLVALRRTSPPPPLNEIGPLVVWISITPVDSLTETGPLAECAFTLPLTWDTLIGPLRVSRSRLALLGACTRKYTCHSASPAEGPAEEKRAPFRLTLMT